MRRFFRWFARFPLFVRYLWLLYRDPRVPMWGKGLFILLAAAYGLWPLDLIPDFLVPLAGVLDDAVIMSALLWLITRVTPRFVRQENRAKAGLAVAGGEK